MLEAVFDSSQLIDMSTGLGGSSIMHSEGMAGYHLINQSGVELTLTDEHGHIIDIVPPLFDVTNTIMLATRTITVAAPRGGFNVVSSYPPTLWSVQVQFYLDPLPVQRTQISSTLAGGIQITAGNSNIGTVNIGPGNTVGIGPGSNAIGSVTLGAGASLIGQVQIAAGAQTIGTVNIGTGNVVAIGPGSNAIGSVTLNAGSATIGTVILGAGNNSIGTVTISGSGNTVVVAQGNGTNVYVGNPAGGNLGVGHPFTFIGTSLCAVSSTTTVVVTADPSYTAFLVTLEQPTATRLRLQGTTTGLIYYDLQPPATTVPIILPVLSPREGGYNFLVTCNAGGACFIDLSGVRGQIATQPISSAATAQGGISSGTFSAQLGAAQTKPAFLMGITGGARISNSRSSMAGGGLSSSWAAIVLQGATTGKALWCGTKSIGPYAIPAASAANTVFLAFDWNVRFENPVACASFWPSDTQLNVLLVTDNDLTSIFSVGPYLVSLLQE